MSNSPNSLRKKKSHQITNSLLRLAVYSSPSRTRQRERYRRTNTLLVAKHSKEPQNQAKPETKSSLPTRPRPFTQKSTPPASSNKKPARNPVAATAKVSTPLSSLPLPRILPTEAEATEVAAGVDADADVGANEVPQQSKSASSISSRTPSELQPDQTVSQAGMQDALLSTAKTNPSILPAIRRSGRRKAPSRKISRARPPRYRPYSMRR